MLDVLTVEKDHGPRMEELPIEFVERKGAGHPDTICDRAAEELSVALSRYYMEHYGRILHHNVDKCVLVGGQAHAVFGGGEVLEPMYLLLVGRASTEAFENGTKAVPLGTMVQSVTKGWMRETLRNLDVDSHIIVDCRIRPGSMDLVNNYHASKEVLRSNDTSFAVAFAPLSETEELVQRAEQLLNAPDFKREFPAVGEDVKVMGLRRGNVIRLTIAAAFVSKLVKSPQEYMEIKEQVRGRVLDESLKHTQREVQVDVNAADDPDKGVYYITVTGLSAEQGDDGQVGRGNRVNGLITPFRPMTLEAAAGKNPTSHVGKIYQVAARRIADEMVKASPDVEQVYCYMLSQIGRPVDRPQSVHLKVFGPIQEDRARRLATPIVQETLEAIPHLWEGFLEKKYRLY
jgi:S-adenosylmethionine synthetase